MNSAGTWFYQSDNKDLWGACLASGVLLGTMGHGKVRQKSVAVLKEFLFCVGKSMYEQIYQNVYKINIYKIKNNYEVAYEDRTLLREIREGCT